MISFFGLTVRHTSAIYERHLMCDGSTLWLGRHALMANVMVAAARDDDNGMRIRMRLAELMCESKVKRRSIEWSP